jgi:transcriptional regulator with XRE-family HTH domain
MPAIDPKSLQQAMDKSGVTPTQLAQATGLSLSYVVRIQRGHRRLKRNPVMRRRIAEALDVPIHWIESKEADAA